MPNVHIFDHPLIRHKLTILRDKRTGHKEFRELTEELAMLMAFEATRDHAVREIEVETPLAKTTGWTIAGREIAAIPILRAGLAMETAITRLIPTAHVGHIGIYRDHDTLHAAAGQLLCQTAARCRAARSDHSRPDAGHRRLDSGRDRHA
jgi:uracil phosphoribosyltransferase